MKVLIVRVGAMGDVLHALPAVAALRRARPDWTLDWVVDQRWASLLSDPTGAGIEVRHVFPAPVKAWSRAPLASATRGSVLQLRRELRAERYDLAVDMQGTIRSAVIARMSGARGVAGFADPREAPARWMYSRAIARRGTHVVSQGAALLGEACGVSLDPAIPRIPTSAEADRWAELAVERRPLCVLAPGAGWAAKQWPAERFGELAAALAKRGFAVVVNAAHADDRLAQQVVETSNGAARVLPCTVAELVALLRRADLFIGGDSGPMHLAATLAVPTVALFGPTDPARNGPWGAGRSEVLRDRASVTSYRHVAVADPGLARISVEQVLAAVDRVVA